MNRCCFRLDLGSASLTTLFSAQFGCQKPLLRIGFEDMVVDALCVEESVDMSASPGLVIEFKGGSNLISLKEN